LYEIRYHTKNQRIPGKPWETCIEKNTRVCYDKTSFQKTNLFQGVNPMKKAYGIISILLLAGMAMSCASKPPPTAPSARRVPGGFPDFVKESLKGAPEDVLVGVGTAKLNSLSQSRTLAANRARAEISRQLNTIVQDMIRDYQASSEVDPESAVSFQENITVSLSKAELTGSTIAGEGEDENGNYWCVVMLNKADVAKGINQASAAAKLAVPKMESFNAEARMNDAFERAAAEEIRAADR
jgi:hypothetical protein